jgi:hypothetical protein
MKMAIQRIWQNALKVLVIGFFSATACARCEPAEEESDASVEENHLESEEHPFKWDYECLGCPDANYFPEEIIKGCRYLGNCQNYSNTADMVKRWADQKMVERVSLGKCGTYSYISVQDFFSSGWTRLFNSSGELVSMYIRADTIGYCNNSTIFECFGRSIRCSKIQEELLENSE